MDDLRPDPNPVLTRSDDVSGTMESGSHPRRSERSQPERIPRPPAPAGVPPPTSAAGGALNSPPVRVSGSGPASSAELAGAAFAYNPARSLPRYSGIEVS